MAASGYIYPMSGCWNRVKPPGLVVFIQFHPPWCAFEGENMWESSVLVPLADQPRHFHRTKEPCEAALDWDSPTAAWPKVTTRDGSFLRGFFGVLPKISSPIFVSNFASQDEKHGLLKSPRWACAACLRPTARPWAPRGAVAETNENKTATVLRKRLCMTLMQQWVGRPSCQFVNTWWQPWIDVPWSIPPKTLDWNAVDNSSTRANVYTDNIGHRWHRRHQDFPSPKGTSKTAPSKRRGRAKWNSPSTLLNIALVRGKMWGITELRFADLEPPQKPV